MEGIEDNYYMSPEFLQLYKNLHSKEKGHVQLKQKAHIPIMIKLNTKFLIFLMKGCCDFMKPLKFILANRKLMPNQAYTTNQSAFKIFFI